MSGIRSKFFANKEAKLKSALRLQFLLNFLNFISPDSWTKLGNILGMFNISIESYFFLFLHQKKNYNFF